MAGLTEGQIMQKVCLAIILCNVALKAKLVNAGSDFNDLDNSGIFLIDLKSAKESALQDLEDNKFKRQTTGSDGIATFDTDLIRSLLEQSNNNNLIAASAVSETPVPLRLMRLSKNSGLRR
ncbi:uncharacterized protein LOC119637236 [Glossina fuscipes]|uniref:Uncharacterized protein LOC119637236 n=1 Tax=Glossina fuscipes TaxID=7396 RepID=A0A9C6DRY8_9MUSC|nr:uncharacterized protein LOC119637236 [Glossina fuscipes]